LGVNMKIKSLSLSLCICAVLGSSVQAAAPNDAAEKSRHFVSGLSVNADTFRRFIVFFSDPYANDIEVRSSLSHSRAVTGIDLKIVRKLATGGWLIESPELNRGDAQRLMEEFARHDEITHAQSDHIYHANTVDPNLSQQWHLTPIGASTYDCKNTCVQAGADVIPAWNHSKGDGVVIAVLDTGYTPNADLVPNLAPPNATTNKVGYDFVGYTSQSAPLDVNDPRFGDPSGPDDDSRDPGTYYPGGSNSVWHGTHVMGLAAAAYDNGIFGAGVAPKAKILPIRVLGIGGQGTDSDITDGIIWAIGGFASPVPPPGSPITPTNTTPARIINLSLGGNQVCDPSSNMQAAINTARQYGTAVVVSAGNDYRDVSGVTPAGCSGVITVAATGYTGAIGRLNDGTAYSNYGAGVTLAAPGGGWINQSETGYIEVPIWSTYNTGATTPGAGSFHGLDGTSMAAPLVSGLAADMAAMKPWLSPDQLKTYMTQFVHQWGTGGVPLPSASNPLGAGLMDANATLAGINSLPAPTVTMSASPTTIVVAPQYSSGMSSLSWNAPKYVKVDMYSSVNSGPWLFNGVLNPVASTPVRVFVGQTVKVALFPHGQTPPNWMLASATITATH
jgi:serine protease